MLVVKICLFKMFYNVWQQQEVGDLEAQKCLPPLSCQFFVCAVSSRLTLYIKFIIGGVIFRQGFFQIE